MFSLMKNVIWGLLYCFSMRFIVDKKFDRYTWKHYLLQSVLAAVSLYAALMVPIIDEPILIAAIGSTSFIVFAMPESETSRPRNVLGGHLACGLLGLLFYNLHSSFIPISATIPLAVGAAIFVMVVLDIEHPPAGGTVIFLVLNPILPALVALLLLSSIICTIAIVLDPYMIDLV